MSTLNVVEPIRDPVKVRDIGAYLKKKSERNYIMFRIGTNVGLRIGDILKLRVRDIRGKDRVTIREEKTRKIKHFAVNPKLKKEIASYCKAMNPEDYLIKSRQGYNKPITRDMAYKILREACELFGVFNAGTHTLRKTFGYHFYLKTKNVVILMKIYNHSDQNVTLRYIGILQDEMDKEMKNFEI